MKRLVSLLLVVCMLVPCLGFAETIEVVDDSVIVDEGEVFGDVFAEEPDEIIQEPVEEDVEFVLPDTEDLVVLTNEGVDGPAPYRELVLLQPSDLLGVAMSTTTIRLSWSPVAFATRYDVYRKLGGESEYTRIASTPNEQLYYDDTSVTPGQVVYYRVQAVNVSYDGSTPVVTYSPQSNTLPFITLATPVLSDPRGLDDDSVRLNWSSIAGASTYEVEIANSAAGPFNLSRQDLTSALCNVDGLTAGQGYYFRVRAVRTFSSGEKFYSAYSNVGCGTAMTRPSLSVTADGNNAVLNWTACAGATGYVLYRKVGTSGSYSKLAIVGNVTSYVDAGRIPGEVCYYYVYAMTPVGAYNCFSLSSTIRYFTVVNAAVINAVQNTAKNEQTINWTDSEGGPTVIGASHYLVYSSTSMDGLYTEIGKTTDTKFVATGLEDGKTYYYKVRAIREFSNGDVSYGPWSNIMSMPEAGVLQLYGLSGTNLTYAQQTGVDINGGYVGDVFTWNVNVCGGSGSYTFRWSLVPINGGTGIVLQNFSDGYVSLEEDQTYLTTSHSVTLSEEHVSLITSQKYAIQVEALDSLGAVAALYACEDTFNELVFVAPKPTTKMVNVTLRAGETLVLEHGVCPEAGDTILMDVSNPTGAVNVTGNIVTALSNGYATILVTPERFKNDILIAYNITVGYAALAINGITPSATTMNNYDVLSWDINYTGGRPNYNVNFKVYRDAILVSENTRVESTSGLLSVNYQVTSPGNYTLEVTITAADGQTVTKRSAVTKVVDYNPVTVVPSVTTATTGTNIAWFTTYTGTNTAVRRDYTLFRDGVVVASSVGTNDFSFSFVPTVAGSYVLKVIVYEANGNRIEVTSSTVTVVQGSSTGAGNGNGTVNAVRVALRKGPSTGYSIIFRIDKGETVTVIKEQDGWYYVDYKGTKGWMMARYITVK
ncbi:MAG: SH3 domain-containing protein [Clostridia bacterium]|nr:SH3 domain-containing protein [Clostridia bacterium]